MADMVKQFKAARRVSVPLVAIRTADPAGTMKLISEMFPDGKVPFLWWDVMHGLRGINSRGKQAAEGVLGGGDPAIVSGRPAEALALIEKLPEDVVVFFLNAHRFWRDEQVAQAIWNLRGLFKSKGSMLVMLTTMGALLPSELSEDVLVIDEPLPTPEQMRGIVNATFDDSIKAGGFKPKSEMVDKAVDALSGLAAFPAEQALAMSLSKSDLDLGGLWDRKRQAIEQTPGLSVWRGGEKFEDIGGCENVKTFITRLIKGKRPPRGIVFIDEIEKAFAGTGTDLSGVKTEMTGEILSFMQDKKVAGVIFIGPPGAAKSVVSKAAGNEADVPTIYFNLGAMQSSLVGESGARLRGALKVVDAVTQGRALFIATCNSIGALPPELRRRFKFGTFFFDLPTSEERKKIWDIYLAKNDLDKDQELPEDAGWTGAEIENCCTLANDLSISLLEAAEYIVPVSKSAGETVQGLRKMCSGKYVSASKPGLYIFHDDIDLSEPAPSKTEAPKVGRKMRFDA